jgi:hypothetical protein
MLEQEALESGAVAHAGAARMWPYHVGAAFLAIAAVGFAFAPFSAIVYVALPGIALSTYFAFSERRSFRVGLAMSSGAFVVGICVGAAGLALVAGAAGRSLAARGWGLSIAVAGLWVLPLLGLVVGAVSLVGVYRGSGKSLSQFSAEEPIEEP